MKNPRYIYVHETKDNHAAAIYTRGWIEHGTPMLAVAASREEADVVAYITAEVLWDEDFDGEPAILSASAAAVLTRKDGVRLLSGPILATIEPDRGLGHLIHLEMVTGELVDMIRRCLHCSP